MSIVAFSNIWKNIPDDLLQIIISYNESIVYRFGKYMSKIPKMDLRYGVVRCVPVPVIRTVTISDADIFLSSVYFTDRRFCLEKYVGFLSGDFLRSRCDLNNVKIFDDKLQIMYMIFVYGDVFIFSKDKNFLGL